MLRRITLVVLASAASCTGLVAPAGPAHADDDVVTVMTTPVLDRTPMLCVPGPRDPDWDDQTCVAPAWTLAFAVPTRAVRAVVTVTAVTANVPQAEECARAAIGPTASTTVCAVRPETAPATAVLDVVVPPGSERVGVDILHLGDDLPTPAETPGSMHVELSVSFAVIVEQTPPPTTTAPPTPAPPTTVATPTTAPPTSAAPVPTTVEETPPADDAPPASSVPPTLPLTGDGLTDRALLVALALIGIGLGLVGGRRLVTKTVSDSD